MRIGYKYMCGKLDELVDPVEADRNLQLVAADDLFS